MGHAERIDALVAHIENLVDRLEADSARARLPVRTDPMTTLPAPPRNPDHGGGTLPAPPIELRVQSFEDIDRRIALVDVDAMSAATRCEIYRAVRPILLSLAGVPFLPKKWRQVLVLFINIMDDTCPEPQTAS